MTKDVVRILEFGFLFLVAARADVPLCTDRPERWKGLGDGGNPAAVSTGEPCGDRPSLRFAYTNARGYGNTRLDGLAIPSDATGVRFKLFVESAARESAMHLWLHERDGDLWLCRVAPTDGKGLAERAGVWRDVFAPFSAFGYQPRGDKRRHFLSCDGLYLGFNYADQTVRVADLAFVVCAATPPPADSAVPVSVDPPGRRIAVLREPTVPRQPGHADPERLARLLGEAGFRPVFICAADLCDAARFSRKTADLLVLPDAPFFPYAGVSNFRAFLKAGGAFFSIGGYAFDRLTDFGPSGWTEPPRWPLAREIDGGRFAAPRLNTRYGEPGDTMKLNRDQIGVFDPSFLLRNVASAAFAPDQYVGTENWRAELPLEGLVAVAMTGNNSPVFPDVYGRWIPLVETFDRLGRPRGPAAALVLNFDGPYAGSNWGFVGVTNRDLFDGSQPALDRLFVSACRRLLAPSYLTAARSQYASYRPGETVALAARVSAPAAAAALTVRFRVDGALVAEQAVADGAARAAWPLPQTGPDFHELSAELLADGRPVDVMRGGFTVWNPALAKIGPRVKVEGNYFSFNGRPHFFGGANTTGMMWYSDNEDPLVWRRDFERMGDFAMNTLRILHFSPFCNATNPAASRGSAAELANRPEKTCRQTDAIVQLAQPNQVAVFLSLHDWIPLDLSDADLKSEQDWNRFWVGRYRAFPGMMYDIQNEPNTALNNEAALRPLYESWLAARYGSLPVAFAAWQGSGAKPVIDFKAKAAGWDDLRVRDNERFRAWVFARWQRANGEAVQSVAPDAPVTVGHLQNLTASEKALDTAGIDFANVHHYGDVRNLRGVLKLTDRRFEGKSFSLGEFGSRVAHTARNAGAWGDPAEDSVRHFLAVGHYAFGMGASFVANWSWKDFRDCVFPWGVNHADLTPKPVLEAYRNQMLLFRSAEPRYAAPALWLVLPDSFRLGPDAVRIHEGLRRAADALLCANAPFGVINEESLDRLPAGARALVWPLAVCPSDETFDRVVAFVDKGGCLLLTGDPRFDADRKPTRPDRLRRLGLAPADAVPEPPFVHKPTENEAMRLDRAENGRVMWSPAPIELCAAEAALPVYRRFLDEASGVARLKVGADDGSALAFDVPLRDGFAVAAVSAATGAVEIAIAAHAGVPAVRGGAAAGRTLYAQLNGEGRVVAAASSLGLDVSGKTVLTPDGDWAFVALDGKDLRESEQVLAMPFGAGRFGLARAAGAVALAGETGEFRAGRWTTLEPQRLSLENGSVCGAADSATAYDLRLLAAEAQMPAARERAERLLRMK